MADFYSFFTKEVITLSLILLGVINWAIFGYLKNRLKTKYLLPYQNDEDIEDTDFYISYYQKAQGINIYRTIIFVVIFLLLLRNWDIHASSILAVATGALIIIFQTFLMSFVVYFLVLSDYQIGDTIKIGENIQGEIISIKPLYTNISGKNDTADHNGKLFRIPNYQIRQNNITKIDLSYDSVIKTLLKIRFDKSKYKYTFEEFTIKLAKFLDASFDINTLETAHNYKSYIGYRYKLNYEPDAEFISIFIGYISNNTQVSSINKKILLFVESCKITD